MFTTRVIIGLLFLANGCAPNVVGLRPIDPPPGYDPRVKSLTPTLRWESFPQPGHLKKLGIDTPSRVTNITYELRIWEQSDVHDPAGDAAGPSIKSLMKPEYQITAALRPDTQYFWTVRAKFQLDGAERMTQWTELYDISAPHYEVTASTALRFWSPRHSAAPGTK